MDRRAITVAGIVQGVGFRPFVYALASHHGLQGFVQNQTGGLMIEVEGENSALDRFVHELKANAPPLARIEALQWESRPLQNDQSFEIVPSDLNPASAIFISPDLATCDECLAELFNPDDRRYRYPFLNCTQCGPRLTIIQCPPYDRDRTTMAPFPMCAQCQAEFEDPTNRRFHAQPTACPACGPRLELLSAAGQRLEAEDPVAFAAEVLADGKIVAVKGLGGFHLVCDARNDAAVELVRQRKQRDEKPFAVMVEDIDAAEQLCQLTSEERKLLLSWRRPIVLVRKRIACPLAGKVAPGNPSLGLMLPYTPLHHLLLREVGGAPLVMTSGNACDDPIAYDDSDARQRLSSVADYFLMHNRRIQLRCDDSVTRVIAGHPALLRRSRGFAPAPVALPVFCRKPILALGGQLRTTIALGRERHAFLSHHLGDLEYYETYREYVATIAHYERLFAVQPELLVCDRHPDYASSRYALERAEKTGVRCLTVQHHHAHMASCMAENALTKPVIGVTFDGTGFGTDGAIWGGEFLTGDLGGFSRAAHFRYVGMPGGEQAIREPWRMALAHLLDAGENPALLNERISPSSIRLVRSLLAGRLNCPVTSSCGRLFDAVGSLIGLRDRTGYEGQPAMELEWLASEEIDSGAYPFELTFHEPTPLPLPGGEPAIGTSNEAPLLGGAGGGFMVAMRVEKNVGTPHEDRGGDGSNPESGEKWGRAVPTPVHSPNALQKEMQAGHEPIVIDTRPVIGAVVRDLHDGISKSVIARRFHSTIINLVTEACRAVRDRVNLNAVVLSGGVFMNAILASEVPQRLKAEGFDVFTQRQVPPNDGGLALGQIAVAATQRNP